MKIRKIGRAAHGKILDRYFAEKLAEHKAALLRFNLSVFARTEWENSEITGLPCIAIDIRKKESDDWITAEHIFPDEALVQLVSLTAEDEKNFIDSVSSWLAKRGGE